MKKSDVLLAKLGASLAQPPSRRRSETKMAAAKPPAPAPVPPPAPAAAQISAPATVSRRSAAEGIVDRFVPFALGAGAVPVPIADLAAIVGLQLKMIADLSALYGVSFAEARAKALVASLLGGVGSVTLAAGVLGSALKAVPAVGTWWGCTSLSLTAGALTWAVGRVFMDHFDSGGTLLDFNPAAVRRLLAEQLEQGRARLRPT